uniref:Iron-binding zinc finger CDGSH type domain-containing protein n=2 Tax=Poecilia TaxID=8080 RepID=A0A096LUL0_POEFO
NMNVAGLMCALRTRCVQTFRRPPLLLPPMSVSSSFFPVQRCLQSTQPVPAARLPYRVKLSAGKRYAWCACGHSKKQPFCDGTHKAKAPSISPLLFTADKNKTVMLCACKQTKNSPYCDGSHLKVIYRDAVKYVKGLFK